jgi:formate hydrogenlyase subunit 4
MSQMSSIEILIVGSIMLTLFVGALVVFREKPVGTRILIGCALVFLIVLILIATFGGRSDVPK